MSERRVEPFAPRVYLAGAGTGELACLGARLRALISQMTSGHVVCPEALTAMISALAPPTVQWHISPSEPEDTAEVIKGLLEGGQDVVCLCFGDGWVESGASEIALALSALEVPHTVLTAPSVTLTALARAGVSLGSAFRVELGDLTRVEGACGSQSWSVAEPGHPRQRMVGLGEGTLQVAGAGSRRSTWFEDRPLHGLRVAVTRARAQAGDMIEALEALGAEAIPCPVIAIEPPPSPEDVLSAIEGLSERDWVVFTSVNGVDRFFEILSSVADARALASCRIACIGPATARALKRWNLRADLLPERYVAEGLIEAFEAHALDGASILIPRAEVAREILPETLRARGAIVDVVPVYRTVPGTPEQSVVQALNAGEVDVITLTASSTATHFRGLFDAAQWSTISKRVCAACIGPITEKTAREVGLEVALTAQIYTVPGLISALVPWWRQQGRGE